MSVAVQHPSNEFLQLYTDFYNQRISSQVTSGTLGIYGYTARPFCEWADSKGILPATITRRDVRTYIAKLTSRGLAPASVNLHGRNIKTVLRFGHLEGVCPQLNFTDLLPRPPVRKQPVARRKDIKCFLANESSLRNRATILLMFASGLRKTETSNLDWRDLDFTSDQIVRIKVRSGKGTKDRITFANDPSKQALLDYRETVSHSPHDPVFQNTRGNRLGAQGIARIYRRLSQETGIKITPHAVRRGFAVEHRKMSVWDLQKLMGHASVETTRLYVETDESDLLESYLENYNGSKPR